MTVDKTAIERLYSLPACHMFLCKNCNLYMLEFESDLYETCLIDYIYLLKFSNIQVITTQKRVLTLTKVWPLPMPYNVYSEKDNMALLSLYTMLKGKYHGEFDLTGSKLCYNAFT